MEAVDPTGRIIDPRHLKKMYAGYRNFTEDALFASRYPLRTLAPHLARQHFAKSLELNWQQRRCLGLYLTTCLPSLLGNTLRNGYRACKARIQSRKTTPQPA